MSFSSVGFFAFLLVGIIVYYVLPKNIQWVWLLILSYLYYFTFSVKASLFMVFATVTIYAGGIWLESIQSPSAWRHFFYYSLNMQVRCLSFSYFSPFPGYIITYHNKISGSKCILTLTDTCGLLHCFTIHVIL